MKTKNLLSIFVGSQLLLSFFLSFFLTGCSKDDEFTEQEELIESKAIQAKALQDTSSVLRNTNLGVCLLPSISLEHSNGMLVASFNFSYLSTCNSAKVSAEANGYSLYYEHEISTLDPRLVIGPPFGPYTCVVTATCKIHEDFEYSGTNTRTATYIYDGYDGYQYEAGQCAGWSGSCSVNITNGDAIVNVEQGDAGPGKRDINSYIIYPTNNPSLRLTSGSLIAGDNRIRIPFDSSSGAIVLRLYNSECGENTHYMEVGLPRNYYDGDFLYLQSYDYH